MKTYGNLGGDSGIHSYEIGSDYVTRISEQYRHGGVQSYEIGGDYIRVYFARGGIYRYDYDSPGRDHVETMKQLAEQGEGLNEYINKHVRANYAEKEA